MKDVSPAGVSARLEVDIESKTYIAKTGEEHPALGAVDFTLLTGEVGAIVGPSGCGKTTLLRLIAGLDRDYVGRIDLGSAPRLGVVFQDPRLLPWRSVDDNIRIAAPRASASELTDLFVRFGLAEHRNLYPTELSLGLARRAALIRALAVKPDLLLLDEPFTSLDAATRGALTEELAEILAERKLTALMVTHDIDAAVRLADVIFVLSGRPGHLVATLPASEARADPAAAAELAAGLKRLA